YLILVTLAGPALCCCSLRGLAESATRPPGRAEWTTADPPPASPPEGGGCCRCHHPKPAPAPAPPPRTDDTPPRELPAPCPCSQHASQPVLPGPQAEAVSPWSLSPLFLGSFSAASFTVSGGAADRLARRAVSSAD